MNSKKPYDPDYYQRHKHKIKIYQRRHYLKYKKKYDNYRKKWRLKNKERVDFLRRSRYQRLKHEISAYSHNYYLKFQKFNPEFWKRKIRNTSLWAKRNPIKFKLCKRLSIIRQRCKNKKYKDYPRYGGKGIKCLLTINDLMLMWDRDKAIKMEIPSIDRINPKGDYILSNCRFIEKIENVRRAHLGIKHSGKHKH